MTLAQEWHPIVYAGQVRKIARKALRLQATRRDHYCCQRCGFRPESRKDLSVHHMQPLANGGADEVENTITLCRNCHDVVEGEAGTTAEAVKGYEPEEATMATKAVTGSEAGVKAKPLEVNEVVTPKATSADWRKIVYGGKQVR